MRVVLDTNVLLVSISSKSEFRPIFDSFINDNITICVTTDILFEYEEIIGKHMGLESANLILRLIENSRNVEFVTNYFKWNLISADPDDNKFVDCAISANAKLLVSNDNHFNILKEINHPNLELMNSYSFRDYLIANGL